MKLILRVFFFFAISTKLFSQTAIPAGKIIYLDSSWVESTEDNYKYIRIVEEYYSEKKSYIIKEYYKSKVLKTIGASSDKDIIKRQGQFVYYYENGNKKSTVNYLDNKKTGKEFNWYENGNIQSEFEYYTNKNNETNYKLNNYWNDKKEQKIISGNGDMEYKDKFIEEAGRVKDGLRDGIWKGKSLKSKYSFSENHQNGKLVSGVSIDSLHIEHPYTTIEQRPTPQKGIKSFYSYVAKSIIIPADARNVTGKIYMTFIVDRDGTLVDPKILKGVGYGIDESVLNVIKNSKKWNPGLKRGIPERAFYSLPITITKNGR